MARWSSIYLLVPCLVIISVGCDGGYQTSTNMPTPTPTPGPTNTVSVTFASPMPVAVAEKIGTGNWTATSLAAGGNLPVALPAGTTRYAVAFLCTWTRTGTPVSVAWVIEADLKDGGYEEFLHYPLNVKLGDWHPRDDMPGTEAADQADANVWQQCGRVGVMPIAANARLTAV